ncbi:Pyruvate decarboxylase, partial [Colletotrichum shisoi]
MAHIILILLLGYAADGYARVKGMSAIITTFGVGELSAINALAGAYSEHIPVIHIVGCPSTVSQKNDMLLHHTLGNSDFNVFSNMNSQISTLHAAKKPIMHIDACAIRYRVLPEVHALLDKTKIPVFVTPMGKGAVNETHPNYGGVYAGTASQPDVAERVESSDLILSVGGLKGDFNTAGFSYRTSQLNTIDFHSTQTRVRYSESPGITMRGVLRKVIARLDPGQLTITASMGVIKRVPSPNSDPSQTITQTYLWPRVGNYLRENDIVVTETGTANFGIWDTRFPAGVTALSQVLWGSIGWSVGAAQGAALAAKDIGQDRNPFSLWMRWLVPADGPGGHHDDSPRLEHNNWQYKELATVFGGTDKTVKKFIVKTKDELERILIDNDFNNPTTLQFVELYLPKEDAPSALIITAE